jgi:hypothetical protein
MSRAEEPEGFLSRWSRRKREAVEAPPEPAEVASPAPPPPATCPIPEVPEIDPATLPPVEELTAESDFSLFLRPGVPAALRGAALRRMWSLDPAIRDFIGPVDYQWDFNTPGGLPLGFAGELVGDVKKLLAQAIGQVDAEDEAKPQVEAAEPEPVPEPPTEPPVEASPEIIADASEAAEPAEAPAGPVPTPPRRRHGGALPV